MIVHGHELEEASQGVLRDSKKQRKVVSNEFIHGLQRKHFLLMDVGPLIGTVVAFYLAYTNILPFGPVEAILLGVFWLITGLGVSAGYHRYFTHRSFTASPVVKSALLIAGAMAGQGGVISWSALHRRHHELSDSAGDPHSPNLHGDGFVQRVKGFLHSHYTWMFQHDYPNVVHYTPDLIRDKLIVKLDRYYYHWVAIGMLLPGVIAGLYYQSLAGVAGGILWGGFVRMFLVGNTIWAINSFLHTFGSRRFNTRDKSRNMGIAGLVTFGESWHNNHHAFPGSASFGLNYKLFDPAYWLISSLEMIGLVSDVKVPSADRILSKEVQS